MAYRLVPILLPALAALGLLACGNGQAKPSLNVIEVQERTSTMSGLYLDPFDETTRNAGRVIGPEAAVAAAQKQFGDFLLSTIESRGNLRLYFGEFAVSGAASPADSTAPSDTRIGHSYYVITSDDGIRCPPSTGGGIDRGGIATPVPSPTPPASCKWEVEVDATTGEAESLTTSATCVEFPAPRTCR